MEDELSGQSYAMAGQHSLSTWTRVYLHGVDRVCRDLRDSVRGDVVIPGVRLHRQPPFGDRTLDRRDSRWRTARAAVSRLDRCLGIGISASD